MFAKFFGKKDPEEENEEEGEEGEGEEGEEGEEESEDVSAEFEDDQGFMQKLISPFLIQDEDPERNGTLNKKAVGILLFSGVLLLLLGIGGFAMKRRMRLKVEPLEPLTEPKPYDFPELQAAAKALREEAWTWYSPSRPRQTIQDYRAVRDRQNSELFEKFRKNFFGELPEQSKLYREKLELWNKQLAPYCRALDMSVLEDAHTRFRTLRTYLHQFHESDPLWKEYSEEKRFVFSREKLEAFAKEYDDLAKKSVKGARQKFIVAQLFLSRSDHYYDLMATYLTEKAKVHNMVMALHPDVQKAWPDLTLVTP